MSFRALALGGLKLAVALILSWLVLRKVDFAHALVITKTLSAPTAVGAMGLLVLQAILAAWRWILVSRYTAVRLPFWPALRLIMVSLFYAQALPSPVPADAARVWGGMCFGSLGEVAIGVFFDRILTLFALLLITFVSLLLWIANDSSQFLMITPVLILGSVFGFLGFFLWCRKPLSRLLPGKASVFAERVVNLIHQFFVSGNFPELAVVSLVVQGLAIATLFVLAQGMGLGLTPMATFIATPVVLLAALMPISVNGWGVREGAMVAVLARFGIGQTEAATLSVIYGLFQLVLGLAGGAFAFLPNGNGDRKVSP